ncbi:MAG TPA: GGDEF domain-containing protein [Jatrophihabitans sp.]|jgi:diguanylate cyclase (GGDEF)-like protein|uniref:GGDEF domain-containing protein n=1 Tax=Jatrophihabitans sp. TaxID=1932789 RepID=UPI002EEB6019
MAASSLTPADGRARRLRTVRSWRLWSVPPKALALIIGVEVLTVLATAVSLVTSYSQCLTVSATTRLAALLLLSIAYSEITHRMQRMRRYLGGAVLVGLHSVWAFAGVLILPIGYSAVLVCGVFAVAAMRRRQQKAVAYRVTYTGATVVLATLAAKVVATAIQPRIVTLPAGALTALAITVSAAAFFLINTVLVIGVIYLASGVHSLTALLPAREELGLEMATLVLGVMTADLYLRLAWLIPAVLVLMLLLQRSSLVSQLEIAATTDSKTGLLNAAAWQELSQRELLRAQREEAPCAVLLMDLDHFKRVNDTAGHLAGDAVLKAIGEALKRELRGYDAVARFGGEEFVVFLDDIGLEEACQVAERILSRIRGLVIPGPRERISLTASIGLAAYPQHGEVITQLIEQADNALYRAKRTGRDRVELPPETPTDGAG